MSSRFSLSVVKERFSREVVVSLLKPTVAGLIGYLLFVLIQPQWLVGVTAEVGCRMTVAIGGERVEILRFPDSPPRIVIHEPSQVQYFDAECSYIDLMFVAVCIIGTMSASIRKRLVTALAALALIAVVNLFRLALLDTLQLHFGVSFQVAHDVPDTLIWYSTFAGLVVYAAWVNRRAQVQRCSASPGRVSDTRHRDVCSPEVL